jgi:hypothetical protein
MLAKTRRRGFYPKFRQVFAAHPVACVALANSNVARRRITAASSPVFTSQHIC